MTPFDLLWISLRTLRANRLRSGITVAIIALGITALVGIITAIRAMNQKLTESFSNLGAAGFTIRFKERNFRLGNNRELKVNRKLVRQQKRSQLNRPISLYEAERFVSAFKYPAQLSLLCYAGPNNTAAAGRRKTNPTVTLLGSDENYLALNGYRIGYGRNLTRPEVTAGADVCLLGHDVAIALFGPEPVAALGQTVRLNDGRYRVVGVLASRGSTFGFSRDNLAVVGYRNLLQYLPSPSFTIGVRATEMGRVEEAMGEAEGLFRAVRRLAVTEENNFVLERSDSIAEKAINSLAYLTAAVVIIGLITVIGAAIGLMNIMLVAVAERTKEIGLAKAIGARRRDVRRQFLCEAVLISVAGALLGVALGVALGNLFALVLRTSFVVPWNWIGYGIGICTAVGLAAGSYPAVMAGKRSPIEALRYE